jgi:hypothetical protein
MKAANREEHKQRVAAWHAAPPWDKPLIPCPRFIAGCPGYCDWPQVSWCALEREGAAGPEDAP